MFENIFNKRTGGRAARGIGSADASGVTLAAIDYSMLVDCSYLNMSAGGVGRWKLPAQLSELVCSSWQGTFLPPLPELLGTLVCNGSLLESLPALPAGLSVLDCGNCALTSLPVLPAGLHQLICLNNALAAVPNIPAGLLELDCAGCGWTAAQINGLLAQLVANGMENGVLDCSGSNAAPTGQGVVDVATLVDRGWTVTTS